MKKEKICVRRNTKSQLFFTRSLKIFRKYPFRTIGILIILLLVLCYYLKISAPTTISKTTLHISALQPLYFHLKDQLRSQKSKYIEILYLDIPVLKYLKNGDAKHDTNLPVAIFIPSFYYGSLEFHNIYEYFYPNFQRILIFDSVRPNMPSQENELSAELSKICLNLQHLKKLFLIGYGDYAITLYELYKKNRICPRRKKCDCLEMSLLNCPINVFNRIIDRLYIN
ncbi:hypothetical protein HZS_1942 [Henneguya salminicola]|nr:hypothetical protein HZS_1942 [Henneguya salminicola]